MATSPKPKTTRTASDADATISATLIRVRAIGVDRRCRAGLCFDREGSVIDVKSITQGQHEAIASDDYLKIEVVTQVPADDTTDQSDAQ
ncbi:hypothetical protein LGM46_03390 [Burkholderia arboris]|uniref:Uncharacterized protein n=1 Tax=Burkholderia metallica TaxID=488729 RepID=A0ABT8PJY4_9BURK|nr:MULTISPECIES: hypothetical protein [Burkholderia cepacia complex]MCA8032011.1 hypothetical protein [Burkholderia arboris]MDN7935181.1 hypothetical protein [Burkholderia metallica]